MTKQFDIILVGGGPVGLAFARNFADSDLTIALIDYQQNIKNPEYDGREIALTHPSKNTLNQLSIWQNIPQNQIFSLNSAKVVNGNSDYSLHFQSPNNNSINQLGYLVSNHLIRKASFESCKQQNNISWFLGEKVISAKANQDFAEVTLASREILRGQLIVAADSKYSFIRQQMGISADLHQFGRTVIVFRINHSESNQQTAFECFFYGITIAILPLTDQLSNCVITIDSKKTADLLNQSKEEWEKLIESKINHLGKINLAGTIHNYPLASVHARKFDELRTALIGDASCAMHPVTAHGYNLGLQGQNILGRLILREFAQNKSIASTKMLNQYTKLHTINTRPLYHGTNAIVKLFTAENKIAKIARHSILRFSNNFPPIKKIIARQLTG